MRRALGVLTTALLAALIVSYGLAQVPTHKLVVKTGDWAEYEVKQVWGDVKAYGRTLKAGDKLRYKLVGTTTGEMETPDGTLIAYIETPLCDVWLNGEQVATGAGPEPAGFAPFTPASDAFWQDFKRLVDSTVEEQYENQANVNEYRFDIGSDVVNIVLDVEMGVPGGVVKTIVKWVIDRDTGVTRSAYFYNKYAYTEFGYSMEMADTNVAGAKPAFLGGVDTWIIIAVVVSVVIVVVVIVGVFFYLRKRRAVAALPMAPPPPAPGAPPAPGTTG